MIDFTKPLPNAAALTHAIRVVGHRDAEGADGVDARVLHWDENTRSYEVDVFLNGPHAEEFDGDVFDHEDSPPGTMHIIHGCRYWRTFAQAFDHFDQDYESDGAVGEIREAYRQLQEKAIEFGWVTERAPNSLVLF